MTKMNGLRYQTNFEFMTKCDYCNRKDAIIFLRYLKNGNVFARCEYCCPVPAQLTNFDIIDDISRKQAIDTKN